MSVFKLKDEYSHVRRNLALVWGLGGSDKDALRFADITRDELDKILLDKKFAQYRKRIMMSPVLIARLNVIKRIEMGDVDTSKWYLERKVKKEFSQRSEVTGAEGKDLGVVVLPQRNNVIEGEVINNDHEQGALEATT